MTNPKPDFLCIGFHKCGTNWLYRVLSDHPEFSMPRVKELDYFLEGKIIPPYSYSELLFNKDTVYRYKKSQLYGLLKKRVPFRELFDKYRFFLKILKPRHDDQWYASLFDRNKIAGDVSPTYCFLKKEHVEEISQKHPHLKIIICLREPISRTWSHIKMNALLRRIDLSPDNIQSLSMELMDIYPSYPEVIDTWSGRFKDVQIVYQDDISTHPEIVLRNLYDFLGCRNKDFISPAARVKAFAGSKESIPKDLRTELMNKFYKEVSTLSARFPNQRPSEWLSKYGLELR